MGHPARRADGVVVVALALGCAAVVPSLGLRPAEVPPGAHALHAFASARLDASLPALITTLSGQGRDGYRALRLNESQMDGWMTAAAIARGRAAFVGMIPGLNDRRWFAWRRWHGSALVGWCARGVRVLDANGPEGFERRTLLVERVLVVGARGDHRWAAWLEGLLLSQAGWRFAPWVPHAQSVEGPRRAHPDLDLWDCDLARPAAISARRPGG